MLSAMRPMPPAVLISPAVVYGGVGWPPQSAMTRKLRSAAATAVGAAAASASAAAERMTPGDEELPSSCTPFAEETKAEPKFAETKKAETKFAATDRERNNQRRA